VRAFPLACNVDPSNAEDHFISCPFVTVCDNRAAVDPAPWLDPDSLRWFDGFIRTGRQP